MANISSQQRLVSIAPMMDWTDRHDRYFLRKISKHCLLYTEMITSAAIVHGDRDRLLAYDVSEHPLALQLGGSDPKELAIAARIGEQYGYDEVNLNVGCPSDRVQSGRFGACLMAEPALVAECIKAMQDAVSIPVTVKTRLGIDHHDSFAFLTDFIDTVADASCDTFIIHARLAWLKGLSPKENREIPPLCYERVYQLKAIRPHLHISINGGVKTIAETQQHLKHVDGVMIGREAYHNPYILADVDNAIYGKRQPIPTRHEILASLFPYIEAHLAKALPLQHISRHILGLFNGQPGAKLWRRHISENAYKKDADLAVLEQAAKYVVEHSRE